MSNGLTRSYYSPRPPQQSASNTAGRLQQARYYALTYKVEEVLSRIRALPGTIRQLIEQEVERRS